MKTFKLLLISVMAALLVLIGGQARADYIDLLLSDTGGNFVHLSSNTGIVSYNGAVGPNFTINITSGITYPGLGTQSQPDLDLLSLNVNSSANADTLFIALSATGYTGTIGTNTLNHSAGGTAQGNVNSIEFQAWYGAGNNFLTVPSEWLKISTLGPFIGPFPISTHFGDTVSSTFDLTASPFALGIISILATSGSSNVSYNSELTMGKVPEPISLILLGSGLAGVGLYRRLRKPKG